MDRCPRHIFNNFSEHLYPTKSVQLNPAESMAVYWKQVEAWKVYYRSTTRSMQGNEILVTSIGDNLLPETQLWIWKYQLKNCNTLSHSDLEMPSVSYSLGPSKCFIHNQTNVLIYGLHFSMWLMPQFIGNTYNRFICGCSVWDYMFNNMASFKAAGNNYSSCMQLSNKNTFLPWSDVLIY